MLTKNIQRLNTFGFKKSIMNRWNSTMPSAATPSSAAAPQMFCFQVIICKYLII